MTSAPETRDGPDLTDDQLNLVVGKLRQITRESTLDHAIRIGSLIIHYFYGGDMTAWRNRGPKTRSFRRLASHPDLPMSASALYRCVAIFELCERLEVVSRWSRITVTHLRVVLPLGETEQRRLLSAANTERWRVQRLEQEARGAASNPAGRRGRRAAHGVQRVARSVDKLIHSSGLVLEGLPEVRRALADEGRERCEHVERSIHDAIRCLEQAREELVRVRRGEPDGRSGMQSPPDRRLDPMTHPSAAEPLVAAPS